MTTEYLGKKNIYIHTYFKLSIHIKNSYSLRFICTNKYDDIFPHSAWETYKCPYPSRRIEEWSYLPQERATTKSYLVRKWAKRLSHLVIPGIFVGLILSRFCANKHISCEFMNVTGMSYPEDSISGVCISLYSPAVLTLSTSSSGFLECRLRVKDFPFDDELSVSYLPLYRISALTVSFAKCITPK